MVVLLAFVGLAIDGGSVYSQRRQMQNAADAGALAGAREICWGNPANATSTARTYAINNNGAEAAAVTLTRGGWGVDVVASENVATSFVRLIGINSIAVPAEAEAVCGGATSACGLWPIGLDQAIWLNLYNGGAGCGDAFYVWSGNNANQNPDCTVYDCDVDNDGRNDVVSMQGRAWLDFSDNVTPSDPFQDTCVQNGCGTQELACWIRSDSNVRLSLPACISGDNGTRAGTKMKWNRALGDYVSVPLFDSTGCGGPVCPGGTSYHVVGLGCVKVTAPGWIQQLELPRLDGSNPSWKDKVIVVAVSCEGKCKTSCGTTNGLPPPDMGVRAVSLIK